MIVPALEPEVSMILLFGSRLLFARRAMSVDGGVGWER